MRKGVKKNKYYRNTKTNEYLGKFIESFDTGSFSRNAYDTSELLHIFEKKALTPQELFVEETEPEEEPGEETKLVEETKPVEETEPGEETI